MKNKKAWIRIAEASIAILIIMSVVLILIANRQPTNISEDVYEKQKQIINMIIENNTLRQDILNKYTVNVNKEISKMIPYNWGFSTNICDMDQICPNPRTINDYYGKDVFIVERIVAATLTTHPDKPKKLKFFVWLK